MGSAAVAPKSTRDEAAEARALKSEALEVLEETESVVGRQLDKVTALAGRVDQFVMGHWVVLLGLLTLLVSTLGRALSAIRNVVKQGADRLRDELADPVDRRRKKGMDELPDRRHRHNRHRVRVRRRLKAHYALVMPNVRVSSAAIREAAKTLVDLYGEDAFKLGLTASDRLAAENPFLTKRWPAATEGDMESWLKARGSSSMARRLVAAAARVNVEDVDERIAKKCNDILDSYGAFLDDETAITVTDDPKLKEIARHAFDLKPGEVKYWHHKSKQVRGEVGILVDDFFDRLLRAGAIKESTSPVSSRLHPVPKLNADGETVGVRFTIDLRDANAHAVPMRYPMPSTDEVLRFLEGKTLFFRCDLPNFFWQLKVESDFNWTTAFEVNTESRGVRKYEWNVLPQGHENSPAVGQRSTVEVFGGELGKSMMAFMDDLPGGVTNEEDMYRVCHFIGARCKLFGLKLRRAKCQFGLRSMRTLGFIVDAQGVRPDPAKVEMIAATAPPTRVEELSSFLGCCEFYRRFIHGFGEIARPLTRLKKKETEWRWGEEESKAFERLKSCLSCYPVLQMLPANCVPIIRCDASKQGLSFILGYVGPDGAEPVSCYGSRQLTDLEVNYSMPELELRAVLEGIKKYEDDIGGRPFIVVTDAKDVKWLMGNPKVEKRVQTRLRTLALGLMDQRILVVHRPGAENKDADFGTRRDRPREEPVDEDGKVALWAHADEMPKLNIDVVDTMDEAGRVVQERMAAARVRRPQGGAGGEAPPYSDFPQHLVWYGAKPARKGKAKAKEKPRWVRLGVLGGQFRPRIVDVPTMDAIARAQRSDPELEAIMVHLEGMAVGRQLHVATTPSLVYELDRTQSGASLLVVRTLEGEFDGEPLSAVPVIPAPLRDAMVELAHHVPFAGHQARELTLARVRTMGWWKGMTRDVEFRVENCMACQRLRKTRSGARLPRFWPAEEPFETVHMDLVGPLYPGRGGAKYVMSMLDRFSRFLVLAPLHDKTSEAVAKTFGEHWVLRFGAPAQVITDRGNEFEKAVPKLCEWLWVSHIRTSAYYPQTNGAVERQHADIKLMLEKLARTEHERWEELLPHVAFAINTSVNTAIDTTPFRVVWGRDPRMVFDAVGIDSASEALGAKDFGKRMAARLNRAWSYVRDMMKERRAKDEAVAGGDSSAEERPRLAKIGPGTLVWVRNVHKGDPDRNVGPYRVVRDMTGGRRESWRVRNLRTGVETTVNQSRMRVFLRERQLGPGAVRGAVPDQERTHNTYCSRCGQAEGRLLMCETCASVWHDKCAGVKASDFRGKDWICPDCGAEAGEDIDEPVDDVSGRVPSTADRIVKKVVFEEAEEPAQGTVEREASPTPTPTPVPSKVVAEPETWIVDEIIDHRYVTPPGNKKGRRLKQYRVKWVDYEEPTWQTRAELQNAGLVNRYEQACREARKVTKPRLDVEPALDEPVVKGLRRSSRLRGVTGAPGRLRHGGGAVMA